MSAQVLFEDEGAFKVASVFSEADASLQVESVTGKRSKIKASHVVLRFHGENLHDFMARAERLTADLDPQFLWEVSGTGEFGFADLATEWYGRKPTPTEAAAVALRLHASPMFFYKRGKGRYQAAPEDNLKAALASAEKKRRQQEQIDAWVAQMKGGQLPDALQAHWARLLWKPDRNTLEVKALEAAAAALQISQPQLFARCGVFASPADYHVQRFSFDRFPDGAAFSGTPDLVAPPVSLPTSDRPAFSIDDEDTTEVDDAFSHVTLADGDIEVGIHIAAPSLLFARGGALDSHAARQLSTVYFPGGKITMLPDAAVSASTLAEGRLCPALSLYVRLHPNSLDVRSTRTVAEWIPVSANLRHHTLETWFNDTAIASGEARNADQPWRDALLSLHRWATHLKALRGATDQTDRQDYTFRLRDGQVIIDKRARGGAVDTVVAEMMIHCNATWGKVLAEAALPGIYRNQVNNKTRMEVSPAQHEGLGVTHYAWSSSPIRRFVDLVNQRQLLVLLGLADKPGYDTEQLQAHIRDFEAAYDAYNEFQRQMERHWCLVYMQQQDQFEWDATLIREDLVRFADLPLINKVVGVPATISPGTHLRVAVSKVDLWAVEFACRYVSKVESAAM